MKFQTGDRVRTCAPLFYPDTVYGTVRNTVCVLGDKYFLCDMDDKRVGGGEGGSWVSEVDHFELVPKEVLSLSSLRHSGRIV